MRKTDDVLMLNPQVPTGPPLGDSNGNSDGIEKKRKRDEEEEEKETEDDRSSEGSAPDKKQKLGEDGMDQPTEVDETRKSEKGCVGVGTLEQNEAALKLYLHVGAQGSDPFDLEELDPKNCKALSSSLWELKVSPPLDDSKTSTWLCSMIHVPVYADSPTPLRATSKQVGQDF